MLKIVRPVSILFIVIFILSACNLPSSNPATEDPNAVFTAAALTVQAMSTYSTTQVTPFNTPTIPPPAATNTPVTFPTLSLPTATFSAPPTPVCDQAQFLKDVTIPDGTIFAPNATFTKTWRIKNAGTCTWSGYSLVFDSGDSMSGTSPTPIGTVSPNQEVDLSANLTAPSTPGSYRGYWRIRNASGVLIPVLGGTQGKSFFVDVKVAVSSAGLDLHTRAPDASWVGTAGVVTFGGPDTDPNGSAMFRNGQKLEDGSSPSKILEIYPQMVNNGQMSGLYPSYTVVSGEHFKAKIGFLAKADGTCGTGSATFQFNYKEAGVLKSLGQWTETCDGTIKDVDVDLSSIAGKTVQFALAVLANGPADQDTAVWVSPRVEIP
ncbi:MAG: NBR1-Ig-like domain-containing protein [Syntrophothermus sp.]